MLEGDQSLIKAAYVSSWKVAFDVRTSQRDIDYN